jgi:hypothetical protein
MQPKKIFTFSAVVESVQFNLTTTAVFLPHQINIDLPPSKGPQRVMGLINGVPFSITLQFRKDQGRYFSISNALRTAAKISAGDTVDVCFRLIDAERADIPEPNDTRPEFGDKMNKICRVSPDGRTQMLQSFMRTAGMIDQRVRNAIKVVESSKAGDIHMQKDRKRKSS